jgi:hypothetical protein
VFLTTILLNHKNEGGCAPATTKRQPQCLKTYGVKNLRAKFTAMPLKGIITKRVQITEQAVARGVARHLAGASKQVGTQDFLGDDA